MDGNAFQSQMPGTLLSLPEGDMAFLPDALPPTWEFSVRLWPLVVEAKRLIGVLDGIGQVLPNPAILLRLTEDREAIQSSALEGTYATPRQLLIFELEPKASESENDPANRYREVYNYRRAIQHAVGSDLPISQRLMRELHSILLDGVRGHHKDPGNFRRIQVAIGSNRRFIPPPPQYLVDCLDQLERYIHSPSPFDPLIDCFFVHYQFETIHPFIDGNGRIGRLLLALMLQQKCGMSKPWLYLSDYFERHRDEYISGLYHISTRADWETWIEFCLRATINQASETVRRCKRLLEIRERFQQKVTATGGNVRLLSVVDGIFSSPFVRVTAVASRFDISYPTAKSDLQKLTQAGILQLLPQATPTTYYAPEVYEVAYEDIAEERGEAAS